MEKPLILALDIGSSSVRAALYDATGAMLPRTLIKTERTFEVDPLGASQLGPDRALAEVAGAVDTVLEKTKKLKGDIKHVAISSFWHSLVGIDAAGKPTTEVLGWADTRSRAYSSHLRKRFDERAVHNRTGAHFHSSYWPAKLLWLRKDFPDVFAKTDRWLSFSDYLALKLFGEAVTSVSMASGTGLMDIRSCGWDTELLRFLKVKSSALPTVAETDSSAYKLNRKFSKRWPRLAAARWSPAIGDGAADNIGAECVTRSRAALMVGTSGAMRVCFAGHPPKVIPDGLWCYRIDRKRIVIGGALSDGGGLYEWLRTTLNLPSNAEELIAKREPGEHGLTFLPFLAGERGTGYHEDAAGAVLGLTLATDPVDILQAAYESVAYRFAEIFDRLRSVSRISEIVASGGALGKSPVWTQIIADVLGQDLSINDAQESSLRGAVLLVLESVGKIKNIEKFQSTNLDKLDFHPECHRAYTLARKRHRMHYEAILKLNS